MVSLRQKLPPLTSLTAFEAAARHLNFTRAAKDMNVTQAAVSRQIQGLEEYLGVPLFRRLHRAMKLTREGDRLHRAVSSGLEQIASAVADIRRERHGPEVTVATSVTFASYWLMSRIAKFRAAHPEIELRLVASGPISDLAAAGIDLAVRHGRGRWSGLDAEHLLDNEIYPVCAPDYFAGRKAPRGPPELVQETLLHLVEYDHNWITWDAWLRSFGVEEPPRKRGLEFDNYLILIQAALGGQGIALGGGRLADEFVDRGALVRPIEAIMRDERAFYLIRPAEIELSEPAALFRDWIHGEAKMAVG